MNKGMEKLLKKYGYMIESVHRENNFGVDYWVYLKEGYICPEMECGTIHEYNLKDVERMLKSVKEVEVKKEEITETTTEEVKTNGKVRYYAVNDNGEEVLLRTSKKNVYEYAVIDKEGLNIKERYMYSLCSSYDKAVKILNSQQEIRKRNYEYCKNNGMIKEANEYKRDIENIKIVKVIKK